ncbi:transposase domain-containing protein [Variovorax fucosicus]
MSLVHSAKLHGRDPLDYLQDILESLPLRPSNRVDVANAK